MKEMIGRTPQVTCLHLLLDMVMAILPLDKGEPKKLNQELDINAILAVTKDELADICRRIRDNKAPGLDTVANKSSLLGPDLTDLSAYLKHA